MKRRLGTWRAFFGLLLVLNSFYSIAWYIVESRLPDVFNGLGVCITLSLGLALLIARPE